MKKKCVIGVRPKSRLGRNCVRRIVRDTLETPTGAASVGLTFQRSGKHIFQQRIAWLLIRRNDCLTPLCIDGLHAVSFQLNFSFSVRARTGSPVSLILIVIIGHSRNLSTFEQSLLFFLAISSMKILLVKSPLMIFLSPLVIGVLKYAEIT